MDSSRFARAASAISASKTSLPRFGSDVEECSVADQPDLISAQFGELSLDLVKAATGHFDAQSVRKFTWCNKAVSVRSCLQTRVSFHGKRFNMESTCNNCTHCSCRQRKPIEKVASSDTRCMTVIAWSITTQLMLAFAYVQSSALQTKLM
jgi:hypothetical protein